MAPSNGTDSTRQGGAATSRPTIGVLTSSLVELYQVQWLGVADAARAQGANLIVFMGRELDSPQRFDAQANVVYELVGSERLDGLIVWTTALQVFSGPERLAELCRGFGPLPIVSVEQPLAGHPCLLMDNHGGMFAVVSHLIEVHGHRRIAFIRGPETHPGAQERYKGYLDALAEYGLPIDPELITPPPKSWYPNEPARWLTELLDRQVDLDAVAATNDSLALGILTALDGQNVRTPEDVAVVGFDDVIGIYSVIDPIHRDLGLGREDRGLEGDALERAVNLSATILPLTTVRAPFYELGGRAVELVLAQIRGESVPEVEKVRTELVVRRSCGCFSAAAQTLAPDPVVRIPSRPAPGEGFAEVLARDREGISAQFREALSLPESGLTADWSDRLLAAYAAELKGESAGRFMHILDDLLRGSMRSGIQLESWWRVLRALHHSSADLLAEDEVARSERLWTQVQLLMEETSERFTAYRGLVAEKRNQLVREVGQRLITALDVDQLANILAEELPNVRIPSCYLASYAPEDYDSGDRGRSRAILAFEQGQRVDVPAEVALFPSRQLVPRGRLEREEPYSVVTVPLYFKEQQLGFVLFEVGPRTGWIYEALQEQLSSALEGALLVERERRALAEVEDASHKIEDARHELEERVAFRTAELAHANEVLTEQILERERAEQIQARLEAQLRQAQKMEAIGRLAGGIAHDFNNLLVVINGYSDLLLRDLPADDPIRSDIEQIQRAGERASTLTGQLLAFSRQQVLQPTVLSLNGVVTNIETMLRRLIGEDVELMTILAPALAPVSADRGQMEQIILNLALNARDAMPAGGRLSISTANVDLDEEYARATLDVEPGSYVVLRVSDTGVGMNEETQARLFEPFFTTKPAGQGTGLGLATVFGIVQQSGGHVRVVSALGEGSTFEVYLPQSARVAPWIAGDHAARPKSFSGSETILVVEDDSGVRGAARRFLEEHGYRVLEASDGREAVRLCREHEGSLDLVITDVVMPGMSGRDLVERLTHIRPQTPVLYVSGHTDSAALRQELSDAAVPLLQKPFTAGALASKVRELLDLHERR